MHTNTNISKWPRAVYQIHPMILTYSTSNLSLWFPQLLSLHKISISQATQMHSVIPHIISHWSENPSPYKQPCSLVPTSWHCAHCDWQASRRWSYTVRHNVVQWSLERTTGSQCDVCVTQTQIAKCRRGRWAGTGQAQCLYKHTDTHTDTHTHIKTCGAVGCIDT